MSEQTESDGARGRLDKPMVYLLVVLALLILGGAVFTYLLLTRRRPTGESEERSPRLVRVFAAENTSHRLAITAYGTSRAAEVWTAIAEVTGRAVEVNPRFEPGEILPEGTLLVGIDRADYELAHDRCRAEAEAQQLQINELDKTEEQLKEILKLQQRQLELAQAEYERERKMNAKKAVSLTVLEAAENAYVTQRTTVQKTDNSLALVAVQRLRLTALLKAATAEMERARRDLDRCQIRLPFGARCASKSIELHQFVTAGERLGTFLALETAEVVALVEIRKVAALLRGAGEGSEPLDLTEIRGEESLWKRVEIPVEVSWELGRQRAVWMGRLARIGSSLDPATRTVPLIIEVRNPYQNIRPGVRLPLFPDVFCRITAYGPTLRDVVVIPRDALHQIARTSLGGKSEGADDGPEGRASVDVDVVYLLDVEQSQERAKTVKGNKAKAPLLTGHLRMAEVSVLALEENSAVISKGLATGDWVILTDLFPAGEGMRLRGEPVRSPVRPRGEIDLPEGLFDEVEGGEGRRGGEPPPGPSPAIAPWAEANP